MKPNPVAIIFFFASLLTSRADAQKVIQVTSNNGKEQETRIVTERKICSSGATTIISEDSAKSASAPSSSPEKVTASPVFCINLETAKQGAGTEPIDSEYEEDEDRGGVGSEGVVIEHKTSRGLAEGKTGQWEGDILTNCEEIKSVYGKAVARKANRLGDCFDEVSSEAAQSSRLWSLRKNGKVEVPYSFRSGDFNKAIKGMIREQLDIIESRTKVVQFIEEENDNGYIQVVNENGCSSFVGKAPLGYQQLSLGPGCIMAGIIQHEFLHALGFWHENSRPDRDNYIDVMSENILPDFQSAFNVRNTAESLGSQYDYGSIMHYDPFAFTKNGFPTINAFGNTIGQRNGMSESDVVRTHLLYQCDTGPRTLDDYESDTCTADCKCWEGAEGCNADNECQGNLVCKNNICSQSGFTIPPVSFPTKSPITSPTDSPITQPTPTPTDSPTKRPTPLPTLSPTVKPTPPPTDSPTKRPSPSLTDSPTKRPTPPPTPSPTPSPTSDFNIELINMGSPTRFDSIFEKAKRRWESIILNDQQDELARPEPFDWFDEIFDTPVNKDVDDLLIGYAVATIDGLNGTLGLAGPIEFRFITDESGNLTVSPISGIMVFDVDDFDKLSDVDAEITILHEMGHVLGIGIITTFFCAPSCNPEPGTVSNFNYFCPIANEKYAEIFPSKTLLLEDDGGSEIRCSHWEDDNFQCDTSSEIMTGFFDSNKAQPLTKVTIGALEDMKAYEVDYGQADQFVCGDGLSDNLGQLIVESENLNDFIAGIQHVGRIPLNKEDVDPPSRRGPRIRN